MKSQGANSETGASPPVYTISSYTEAHPQHVCRSVHAEQSDCIIWVYSSICVAASPETRFMLCPPPRRPHPPTQAAKFEKWKKGTMQSGHILQPAVK